MPERRRRQFQQFRWLLLFAIWTLAGLLYSSFQYLGFVEANRLARVPLALPPLTPMLVWNMTAFYLWAAVSPLIIFFARRMPVTGKRWALNLLLHIPVGVGIMALHLLVWAVLFWYVSGDARQGQFASFGAYYRFQFTAGFMTKMMVYIIILMVVHALDYYQKYRSEELKASQLRGQLAEAQLQALKMQLHPHFLFNTLNAISELVYRDPDKADRMITHLSDMLRLSLEKVGAQEVPLKQELEFLRKYLEIEQTRFEERLRVEMRIAPDALDACVPNMILQPIVENAVRHGIAPLSAGGRIEIRAVREDGMLRLDVCDNGRGLQPEAAGGRSAQRSGGVGLSNTRARLAHLYGARHRFELQSDPEGGRGLTVHMAIPYRESARETESEDQGTLGG